MGMHPKLDEIELRILGVLMEKALTQASTYPMTMNAIVLGANQKQNRDPVVEFSEADVARALTRLQQKGLVKQAPPSPGARSNRFGHACVDVFHWDRREQAIMTELLIRGRQTPGELRTHASRMTPFTDLEAVGNTLSELTRREPAFVEELPREPGRSANRWRHLLAPDESPSSLSSGPDTISAEAPPVPFRSSDLSERVARLEATVADLAEAVAELRERVERPSGDETATVL